MTRTAATLRTIAAPIAGYVVIALCTTLSFRLAGGINLRSPLPNFILGTLGISASGLLGGITAGLIGGRKPVWHATSVLIFLLIDSVTVLFFRRRPHIDPLWFRIISAIGLMLATLAGGILLSLIQGRTAHRLSKRSAMGRSEG